MAGKVSVNSNTLKLFNKYKTITVFISQQLSQTWWKSRRKDLCFILIFFCLETSKLVPGLWGHSYLHWGSSTSDDQWTRLFFCPDVRAEDGFLPYPTKLQAVHFTLWQWNCSEYWRKQVCRVCADDAQWGDDCEELSMYQRCCCIVWFSLRLPSLRWQQSYSLTLCMMVMMSLSVCIM